MALEDLTAQQINSFIANYENSGKIEGGKFSLSELRLEKQRRIISPFPPAETAKAIVEMAQTSKDGLVTYKDVWQRFRPNAVWTGNAPRAEMAKALGRVIAYCIDNELPILTALVVKGSTRSHSPEAIQNICNEVRSYGIDVGTEPREFVKGEQDRSRTLVAEALPKF
ncbi:hypothetical protein [Sphingopyxis panaciterrae]